MRHYRCLAFPGSWIALAMWSFPLYTSAKIQVWKLWQQIWSSGKTKICILRFYFKVKKVQGDWKWWRKKKVFKNWKAKLNSRDWRVKPGSQLRACLTLFLGVLFVSYFPHALLGGGQFLPWSLGKRAHIQRNGGYLAGWDHQPGWYPWGTPLGLCP